MRISRFLVLLGVSAIPLWYLYRTLSEKQVSYLDWDEVFMTPWARKEKELEKAKADEEKARVQREEAEARRQRMALESERAREKAQVAAVELAKANALAAQEKAEADRRLLEQQRRNAEAEAARVRAEVANKDLQRRASARVHRCEELAERARGEHRLLLEEQKQYQARVAEALKAGINWPTSRIPREVNERAIQVSKFSVETASRLLADDAQKARFTQTFRHIYIPATESGADEIEERREACEQAATKPEDDSSFNWEKGRLETLPAHYRDQVARLKRSHSQIVNLIDFFNGKLPDTLDGLVIRDRVERLISEAPSK